MNTPGLYPSLTEADRIEIRLAALNDCAPDVARVQFGRCCGSSRWIHGMEQARPFANFAELEAFADRMWAACSREDWVEAFSAHPRIGEQSDNRWSRQEQSRVAEAPSLLLETLARANRAYEAKFGYTFIVCATGKSAPEILATLERRLNNDVDRELENAAEQQSLILQLRLRRLFSA
jgi:2-oxo-4-hydroxy-4-carboxy-5-ureidoimidazoline decarboxylase